MRAPRRKSSFRRTEPGHGSPQARRRGARHPTRTRPLRSPGPSAARRRGSAAPLRAQPRKPKRTTAQQRHEGILPMDRSQHGRHEQTEIPHQILAKRPLGNDAMLVRNHLVSALDWQRDSPWFRCAAPRACGWRDKTVARAHGRREPDPSHRAARSADLAARLRKHLAGYHSGRCRPSARSRPASFRPETTTASNSHRQ